MWPCQMANHSLSDIFDQSHKLNLFQSVDSSHILLKLTNLLPIFLYGVRKYKSINSQATIIAGVVLYNIYRDLTDEEPPLPPSMSLERFDALMNSQTECTVTTRPDSNSYVRDRIVAQLFT